MKRNEYKKTRVLDVDSWKNGKETTMSGKQRKERGEGAQNRDEEMKRKNPKKNGLDWKRQE